MNIGYRPLLQQNAGLNLKSQSQPAFKGELTLENTTACGKTIKQFLGPDNVAAIEEIVAKMHPDVTIGISEKFGNLLYHFHIHGPENSGALKWTENHGRASRNVNVLAKRIRSVLNRFFETGPDSTPLPIDEVTHRLFGKKDNL